MQNILPMCEHPRKCTAVRAESWGRCRECSTTASSTASGFGTIVKTIDPPHPTSCASSRGASFESLSEPPKIRPPGSDLGKPQRRCPVDASRWLAPVRTLRQRYPAPSLTVHAARAAGSCSRRARSLYEVQQQQATAPSSLAQYRACAAPQQPRCEPWRPGWRARCELQAPLVAPQDASVCVPGCGRGTRSRQAGRVARCGPR